MKQSRSLFHFLFLTLFCFVILSSCSDTHIYHKYKKIPDYIWNYKLEVPFEFTIKDTIAYYNIYLNIRNAGIYPYSNIWIIASRQDASGVLTRNRYEFILANPDGTWTGSGLGDIIDNRFLIEEHIRFEQIGDYKYTFRHDMRIDNLPSIMDVGLEVEKVP
jgi:gliding motility-associated lipoprotein GldH